MGEAEVVNHGVGLLDDGVSLHALDAGVEPEVLKHGQTGTKILLVLLMLSFTVIILVKEDVVLRAGAE